MRESAGEAFDAMGVAFDSTATVFGGTTGRESQAVEEALERLSATVAAAARGEEVRFARLRAGLVAFLAFFDDEPAWGRVLVLDAPSSWSRATARERRVLGALRELLEERSDAPERSALSPALLVELVLGGVFAVIRAQLLEGEDAGPLVELTPSLMAFIAAHYLGQAAASAELAEMPEADEKAPAQTVKRRSDELAIRVTRRTLLVLGAIGRAPGSSNRRVAELAGLSDEGQTSRLLARLAERGLVRNVGVGAAGGEPNAWLLTVRGRRMLELSGAAQRADAASWRGRRARGWA
jgi:DNA-binding MarR family transcriptional regulator